jgi:uncharacterized protein YdhG (YjbR/CyaY superfamily)
MVLECLDGNITRRFDEVEMKPPESVSEYIAGQPRAAQAALRRVRSVLRKALPGAQEVISYGIPAYQLHGRRVLYFAGWKQHYSIYPVTTRLIAAFGDALAPYEYNGKGTLRLPLDKPVPARLLARIAKFRVKEEAVRSELKAAATKKR